MKKSNLQYHSMLHVETVTHLPFQIHSYVVWSEHSRQAIAIDMGRNVQVVLDIFERHQLVCEDIFHTHGFLEFLEGQPLIRQHLDIVAHMNPLDEFWLAHLDTQATLLTVEHIPQAFVDQQVWGGDVISYDGIGVHALATPGNTPGGMSYYIPGAGVFVGDTLYAGSLGPTDIPHGNTDQLIESVRQQLFTLPDETVIYPGRGPKTMVAQEKSTNSLTPKPYSIWPAEWSALP